METKKTNNADLENKKTIFMQIGLVFSLALVLIAFEWTSSDSRSSTSLNVSDIQAEEEIIPITRQEDVKAPPPPPPAKVSDVLSIVEDNSDLKEELNINTEMTEESKVNITVIDNTPAPVEEEEAEDAPVFFIVEEMPEFPGGNTALQSYIANSIKYPVIAQENGVQGRVYISFVVNPKGLVEQVKVVRGVDSNLDKEAIRVIESLPAWKPGKQRGKPVKVSFTVPINFVLQ
jgi:protein TonB